MATLIDNSAIEDSFSMILGTSHRLVAQSFSLSSDFYITGISIAGFVDANENPPGGPITGNLVVGIVPTAPDFPYKVSDISYIVSSTLNVSGFTYFGPSEKPMYAYLLSSWVTTGSLGGAMLSADTKYWILLDPRGLVGGDQADLYLVENNDYSGQTGLRGVITGDDISWSGSGVSDLGFILYGILASTVANSERKPPYVAPPADGIFEGIGYLIADGVLKEPDDGTLLEDGTTVQHIIDVGLNRTYPYQWGAGDEWSFRINSGKKKRNMRHQVLGKNSYGKVH